MKKYLLLLVLSVTILLFNYGKINAQRGERYEGKLPKVNIYSSGKVEQFRIKAQNRMKAGEEPTANFEVTYHNFSDNAKASFAKAVELWSYLIHSSVTIKIDATWEQLDAGVLGSAGANSFRRDFKNAPYISTWYPIAIANKLAGYDLEPDNFDIKAHFSSSFNWYLGTDGNCPTNQYDFISTVMHEIGHGLGFIGSANVEGTQGSWGSGTKFPFVFDRFVYNNSGELLIDTLTFNNPSTQLKTEYTSGDVFFHSELSDAAAGSGHAELYVPSAWDDGSSYSHLAEKYNATYNAMMTYSAGTGEVTHNPGPITLGMFAEMGWINILFKHKTIKDMESMPSPLTIETEIISDSSLIAGSVYLHYSIDNFSTDNAVLMSTSNGTLFTASIPTQAAGLVNYYFEATTNNLNRKYFYPVQADFPVSSVDSTLSFTIGTDNVDPTLEHTPEKSIFNFETNLVLNIGADDNLGIDSVYLEYKINSGSLSVLKCDSITFNEVDNLYMYQTSIPVESLQDGDTVYYRITAVDLAATSNSTIFPATGFQGTLILDLAEATQDLTINFDETADEGLFFENGLTVSQPGGFTSKGLHSPHPYEEGDPLPTDEISYSAMLKVPIILKDNDAYIRFDEIVIVEPGSTGSVYGGDEFWDYVVIEGSKDSAKTWFEFEDGYDSRVTSAFTTAFNNNSNGTESMYKSHMINLLGNNNLKGNDKVLIRFRLWSDQLTAGWGWAIDNIEIQGTVSSVEPNLLQTEDFIVFPSPSKGIFDIDLSPEKPVKEYTVIIYNTLGKVIYNETKATSGGGIKHHVDITGNNPGIYFLKLNYGDKTVSKKIITN